jgi:hypothetical protein
MKGQAVSAQARTMVCELVGVGTNVSAASKIDYLDLALGVHEQIVRL